MKKITLLINLLFLVFIFPGKSVIANPRQDFDAMAPAAASNLMIIAGSNGALSALLYWTNPTTSVNGSSLTSLTAIEVYRNNVLISTINNPPIGGLGQFADNNIAQAGNYTYSIVGVNSAGSGPAAQSSSYIGHDVPAAPSNILLKNQGADGIITWHAPTTGLNGGHFTPAGLFYNIIRYPGEVVVATNITSTSWLDTSIPALSTYHYKIVALNAYGKGGETLTNKALLGGVGINGVNVGTAQTIPPFTAPFDLWFDNSLAQAIYFPEEIGDNQGMIMGVVYYNRFLHANCPNEEIRIYAGITTANDFSNGFLPGEVFTLVFHGHIDFPKGQNAIVIPFDQPFEYTGGNLVIMTNKVYNPFMGANFDNFYNTQTPDRPARMRTIMHMNVVYDPLNPPTGGSNRNWVPNTTFMFNTSGLGSVLGTVKDELNNPLENVTAYHNLLPISATSSIEGIFSLANLSAGDHTITLKKVGYQDLQVTFEIIAGQTTNINAVMEPVNAVSLSGMVHSNETGPLQGAEVSLSGYNNYTAVTGEDGSFLIQDVFVSNTYTLRVTAPGHIPYVVQLEVGFEDIVLDNIILEATYIFEVVIGEGTLFPPNRIPFDFFSRNGISQAMYYPSELGISGGAIYGVSYKPHLVSNIENREVRIWLGETQMQDLSEGWVDPSTLTQVFHGTISIPSGPATVTIDFDEPYIYQGGNLVIYAHRLWDASYFNASDRFHATEHPGSSRTRMLSSSEVVINHQSIPSMGTLVHWVPNTTLYVQETALGTMSGVVTDGLNPLEGVKVSMMGTSVKTYTNSQGEYAFDYLIPGTYTVQFNLFGYEILEVENVVISADQNVVLDGQLQIIPRYSLTGIIKGNDGEFLEGTRVLLEGYDKYTVITGYDGSFLAQEIYEGTYLLKIAAAGYEVYVNESFLINCDTDMGIITLPEILFPPKDLEVDVDYQQDSDAMFSYSQTTSEKKFRYDDGTVTGQLGSQNGLWTTVIGSVHRNDAVLTDMSWFLTSNGGPHSFVKVWVFGLDENGHPNRHDILFEQANVPNTDLEWNTFVFPEPVDAQNGFLLGISYQGFLALGRDAGTHPDWPFKPNTHFFAGDILMNDFIAIEQLGNFQFNLMVRASGINHGDILFDKNPRTAQKPQRNNSSIELQDISTQMALQTGMPDHVREKSGSRVLESFNIFLNGSIVATEIENTYYVFTGLDEGDHTAGVQAVYTTGVSPIEEIDFSIIYGVDINLNITTNSGDAPLDAEILLKNKTLPQYQYQVYSDANGVINVAGVKKGLYSLMITLEGFHTHEQEINIQENTQIYVELIEIIADPYGLLVKWDDTAAGKARFSWNNELPQEFFEGFEGSFPPEGWIKFNLDGGTGWRQLAAGTSPVPGWGAGTAFAAPDGGNFMAFAGHSTGGVSSNNQWLVTPSIPGWGRL
jgi:hypothetical protein